MSLFFLPTSKSHMNDNGMFELIMENCKFAGFFGVISRKFHMILALKIMTEILFLYIRPYGQIHTIELSKFEIRHEENDHRIECVV